MYAWWMYVCMNSIVRCNHPAHAFVCIYRYNLSPEQAAFGLDKYSLLRTSASNRCPAPPQCNPGYRYRSGDGSCNNLQVPQWGQSRTPMQRLLPPAYQDGKVRLFLKVGSWTSHWNIRLVGTGIWSPRVAVSGRELPSARTVSNLIVSDGNQPDLRWTLMTMQWGQFLDHDITFAPIFKLGLFIRSFVCLIEHMNRTTSVSCRRGRVGGSKMLWGRRCGGSSSSSRLLPHPHLPAGSLLRTIPGQPVIFCAFACDRENYGRRVTSTVTDVHRNDAWTSSEAFPLLESAVPSDLRNRWYTVGLVLVISSIACRVVTILRRQMNQVTPWLDGNTVYGSDEEAARRLRAFQGGRMKSFQLNGRSLLPLQTERGDECTEPQHGIHCFAAGEF